MGGITGRARRRSVPCRGVARLPAHPGISRLCLPRLHRAVKPWGSRGRAPSPLCIRRVGSRCRGGSERSGGKPFCKRAHLTWIRNHRRCPALSLTPPPLYRSQGTWVTDWPVYIQQMDPGSARSEQKRKGLNSASFPGEAVGGGEGDWREGGGEERRIGGPKELLARLSFEIGDLLLLPY